MVRTAFYDSEYSRWMIERIRVKAAGLHGRCFPQLNCVQCKDHTISRWLLLVPIKSLSISVVMENNLHHQFVTRYECDYVVE